MMRRDHTFPWHDVLKLAYTVAVDVLLIGALAWIVTAPFWMTGLAWATAMLIASWGRCA